MAIIQCPNNHYYDDKRDRTCPYCAKLQSAPEMAFGFNEQLTSYAPNIPDWQEDGQPTQGYGDYVEDYEKTIGVFLDENHSSLTVGWLVCVQGVEKGKSYPIYSGRNFAGASVDMDIVLPEEPLIRPEKHFALVYDPKSIAFYAVSGAGAVYINEEALVNTRQIFEADTLQVGQNKFLFVPFCKEGRQW